LHVYHPLSFLTTGWTHRRLIVRLARRKIEARYRGSMLGSLWTLIQPLLLLSVYSFVFGSVFDSRWRLQDGHETHFALAVFAGMVLFSVFSDCVNEAPGLLINNQIYIKQVRFPVEVLPWVNLLGALFTFAVNSAMLLAFVLFARGLPPRAALALPVVLAPLLLLTLGVTWMLSSAGVFLRDLGPIAGVATTALMFLSPVFYPVTRIPAPFRSYYAFNPFVSIIEGFRGALFEGRWPEPRVLLLSTLAGWGVAWLGYAGFMKAKRGFADVL
jgi:lipopolysaccharide transport system permease protein